LLRIFSGTPARLGPARPSVGESPCSAPKPVLPNYDSSAFNDYLLKDSYFTTFVAPKPTKAIRQLPKYFFGGRLPFARSDLAAQEITAIQIHNNGT